MKKFLQILLNLQIKAAWIQSKKLTYYKENKKADKIFCQPFYFYACFIVNSSLIFCNRLSVNDLIAMRFWY